MLIPEKMEIVLKPDYLGIALIGLTVLLILVVNKKVL